MFVVDTQEQAAVKHWTLDPARSSVDFAVGTFWGLGTVRGHFESFDGFYEVGPDGEKIQLTVDAETVDTGNDTRDEHLRSWDFFDVVRHRYVRFTSTEVVDAGDGTLQVSGNLEVAGRSVPIEVEATVRGVGSELEIETTTTVDQSSFEMSKGPFGMIRTPATVHVKARLV
jgi:polyisoprenoid-binding protein YceI